MPVLPKPLTIIISKIWGRVEVIKWEKMSECLLANVNSRLGTCEDLPDEVWWKQCGWNLCWTDRMLSRGVMRQQVQADTPTAEESLGRGDNLSSKLGHFWRWRGHYDNSTRPSPSWANQDKWWLLLIAFWEWGTGRGNQNHYLPWHFFLILHYVLQ